VIVYSYSGSLNVTSSLANVRVQRDDLRVFPIALLAIFGGESYALTEIHPENVERVADANMALRDTACEETVDRLFALSNSCQWGVPLVCPSDRWGALCCCFTCFLKEAFWLSA